MELLFGKTRQFLLDAAPYQAVVFLYQLLTLFGKRDVDDTPVHLIRLADDYTEAYFSHGLAVQTAEAAAEYLHRHIRRELGLPEERGKRYSWGYPAIPELDDHRLVFDLLPAERDLGMELTAAYQLVPEQSTAAIVVHHPEASYYNIGKSRVEQLLEANPTS